MKKQLDNKNMGKPLKQIITTVFISMLIVLFIAGCDKTDLESKEPEKAEIQKIKDGDYAMAVRQSKYLGDDWMDNDFSFDYIVVERMSNTSVEEKANKTIEKAVSPWLKGVYSQALEVGFKIYEHSSQYLSFGNSFVFGSSKQRDYVYKFITIDMKSGKRVMLDDLVEINAAFVEYIRNNKLAEASKRTDANEIDSVEENLWKYLEDFTPDDLLHALEECSEKQEPDAAKTGSDYSKTIDSLMHTNSFYLKSGKLVIVIGNGKGGIHITFKLEDIRDYLKVEPWS